MEHLEYPWYVVVGDDTLEQGDIISDCPVFVVPSDLDVDGLEGDGAADSPLSVPFDYQRCNVIVMSQTCDLVKERPKTKEVLLCPLNKRSDYEAGGMTSHDKWENARKGRFPAYHVINGCDHTGHESEPLMVNFREALALPLDFLRNLASRREERVRLLPPYREHLSQAFARFFMRVGLPVDIPEFR